MFTSKITKLVDEKEVLLENVKEQKNIGKRMSELRLALQKEDVLDEIDRIVFESIVEKVIVGAEDEEGNIDPFKLTFVFKGNGWYLNKKVSTLIKILIIQISKKIYTYDLGVYFFTIILITYFPINY